MVTGQQVINALKKDFSGCPKGVELKIVAINLLRTRIPLEVCNIIQGAKDNEILLPNICETLPYLNEEDLELLCNCGVTTSELNEYLIMNV